MAIDTAQKRKSVATVASYWNAPSVIADGSFNQADRQHIGWSYSGILAGAAVIEARLFITLVSLAQHRGLEVTTRSHNDILVSIASHLGITVSTRG